MIDLQLKLTDEEITDIWNKNLMRPSRVMSDAATAKVAWDRLDRLKAAQQRLEAVYGKRETCSALAGIIDSWEEEYEAQGIERPISLQPGGNSSHAGAEQPE